VTSEVLTVANRITAFWGIASRSLIEVDLRFSGQYCLYHQGYRPDNGGRSTSETSVNF
jgi:hypothetical protein